VVLVARRREPVARRPVRVAAASEEALRAVWAARGQWRESARAVERERWLERERARVRERARAPERKPVRRVRRVLRDREREELGEEEPVELAEVLGPLARAAGPRA